MSDRAPTDLPSRRPTKCVQSRTEGIRATRAKVSVSRDFRRPNSWHPDCPRCERSARHPYGHYRAAASFVRYPPPVFTATKLEAFADRGKGDFLASHDLGNITTVVDGCSQLIDEVVETSPEMRSHLCAQFAALLQDAHFLDAVPGYLSSDTQRQVRIPVILERLHQISGLTLPRGLDGPVKFHQDGIGTSDQTRNAPLETPGAAGRHRWHDRLTRLR